jgi:hypothetical protein
MITDYSQFDYNQTFLYNYNIFNNSKNVGIGTNTPSHILEVYNNINTSGNINIIGNIFIKNSLSDINILQYLPNTNQIKPAKLLDYANNFNTNKYQWSLNNNTLSLEFHNKKDNTPYYFQSNQYLLNTNNTTIKLFSKYNTSITYLYLYTITNNQINNTTINTNFTITFNSVNFTLTKIQDFYYKLSSPLILQKNLYNTFIFSNFPNSTYIVFLGNYNFNSGFLWNSNNLNYNTNNPIYIFNNISILSNHNNLYQLFINGSSIISNNSTIKNTLDTHTTNITGSIINKGVTNIDSTISSNKLFINTYNNNIGIGTSTPHTFFSVGDNFYIHLNGNVHTHNIDTNSTNLLLSDTNSIIHNNNHIITFKKTNNFYKNTFNNLTISKPSSNYASLNDTFIYIDNNLNIGTSDNNNRLNIEGNFKNNGSLTITDNINVNHLLNGSTVNSMNCNIFTNKNLLKINSFLTTKYLHTKNTTLTSLKIPIHYNINKNISGTFYFNLNNDHFMGISKNKHLKFHNLNKKRNAIPIFNNYIIKGYSDFLFTQSSSTYSNNINVSHKYILPKKNFYNSIYKINNNTSNILSSIRFNSSSLYPEIFTGYNWASIKYNNSDSEIKNIYLGNSNKLSPIFHPRIFNYIYTDSNVIIPNNIFITTTPFTHININISYPSSNTYLNNINNSYEYNSYNFNYSTATNILIKSNLNLSNEYLSYNIKINLT